MKPVRILYFIENEMPTAEQQLEAMKLKAHVMFRLAPVVQNTQHALEACDGVTGAVPPIYAAAYPSAEEAIAKREREFQELVARAGEKVGEGPREPKPQGSNKQPSTAKNESDEPEKPSDDDSEDEEPTESEKAPAAPHAPAKPAQQPAHHTRGKAQARPSQTPAAPASTPAPAGDSPIWKPNK